MDTFLPAASREELHAVFRKLISDEMQSPEYYENLVLTKSGEERLIAWHNTLLRDENGMILSTLSSGEDITERKRVEEEIHRRAEETAALLQTSLALTSLNLEATLQTIGNSANQLFLADGCRIFLLEPDGESLRCVLALGENTSAFLNLRIKLGEGVTGAVAARGKPEIVNEMQDDPRAVQVSGTEEEQEAIMFAPLKERDRVIGILSIRRVGGERRFQPADLELLEAFASMTASAVSNARLFEETHQRLSELNASEERFRQLADNIQEVFWMTDAESGRELYMSPAAETIWGRPIQSLMYEPDAFITSVFSEDRPAVMAAIEKEKNGERVQIEYRIVRPDGTLRWIWDRAFPILDESGKVSRIAGISADVTERIESEMALVKSQNRYRELFDSSPISIWEEDFSLAKKQIDALQSNGVTDVKEYLSNHPEFVRKLASLVKITDVNNASMELYGVDRKEALLHSLADIADHTSLQHFKEELVGLVSPLKRFSWEGMDETRVGKPIVVLVNGSIPDGHEMDWSKVIVSIMDVTERRKAERELHKLSRAVEHSGSAIVITDTSGLIEYVNPKFTEITGYTLEEIIGQNPRILKSGLTPDEEYKQLWQTISYGHEWHGELLNKKKDGTLFWESATISPILNDHREITHFVGVKEDITERKRNELETRRHIAELEAVYENGLSVGRLLKPDEIGERVIETFARYLPWHHVTIRLRKEGSDDLELVSFNLPNLKEEERTDAELHFIARVNRVGQGLSGWVIETGMPLRTGNVHAHPQYIDTHAGIQSGLYMPLKVGDRIIGVISVESEVPDAFTEQDQRLLATLANQTAIAFENARLYEAMQKELSERKRVEDALRVSETHYRALADSITDILYELDQDLRFTHWNKAAESVTGVPVEYAIGKTMTEILGETGEQARIKTIYEQVLRTHQPKTFETSVMIGAENRFLDVNAYPSMRGVLVVAKDVTDRKRTETIMQKRFELMEYSGRHSLKDLMQKTVDEASELTGSTIGFFHFMEEDQVHLGMQAWSTNSLQLFQVSPGDGAHRPLDQAGVWAEAVRQRRPLIQNQYESLAKKKGLPQGHVPILREMIIPIIRSERVLAVMGVGNKPQDYTAHDLDVAARLADYAWDITERKLMEIALEVERNQLVQRVEERTADLSRANSNLARALRVKDEFLANMSHELRTPLNAILGLSESLGEQIAGPLNEKQQKYISTISESGHHLLSLINDILDLAKIDAGQITLDINKVDVHAVCQASLRMIKQLAQKKNQEVSLEIDQGLGLIWADERRLKQMIVNLLGNAVKFTPENGKLGLEVHGDEEANQIAITVWDDGIGIRPEDLARLFQPFVQLDSGLAREATGTGLGLALVAQMARLHGGSVSAISEASKGSRFTIILPWEPALAIDTASRMKITGKFRALKADEKHKPTILLVEDTKEVVMMIRDYLELAGYRVFTAQDGIDGIVQARHVKPDLILMDVQMPRMDGFETTRKLRSDPNFRYTPIIALTALAMPHDRERCLEAGMDEYISKPVNLKALVKIIQGCLFEQESRTR
jgi:PAS domain S-box-containing protein